MSETLKANLLLLLTALIWGCAFVAQRVGMEHVGPFIFNGVRFALGAAALVPLVRASRRAASPPPPGVARSTGGWAVVWPGLLLGTFLFAGASLQQVGMVYTTAGKAGFITGLYVVLVPLLGLFLRQRAGLGAWTGALLAAAGMYLLSVTEALEMAFGDLLVFVGAFFWAGHVLTVDWLARRVPPVRLARDQFVVCAVLSLVVGLSTETTTLEGLIGAAVPILYGGLLSVGVAYTLQVVAQRRAKPAHAAIILSLEAVFAALAGWAMLGETLSTRGMLGCGLMLVGMLLSQLIP